MFWSVITRFGCIRSVSLAKRAARSTHSRNLRHQLALALSSRLAGMRIRIFRSSHTNQFSMHHRSDSIRPSNASGWATPMRQPWICAQPVIPGGKRCRSEQCCARSLNASAFSVRAGIAWGRGLTKDRSPARTLNYCGNLSREVLRMIPPTHVPRASPRVTTCVASGSVWSTYMDRNFNTSIGHSTGHRKWHSSGCHCLVSAPARGSGAALRRHRPEAQRAVRSGPPRRPHPPKVKSATHAAGIAAQPQLPPQ